MAKTKIQAAAPDRTSLRSVLQQQSQPPTQQAGPSPTAQTTTSLLPPLHGNPSAIRTADVMMAPGQRGSHTGRARMMHSMQRTMGNTRLSRLWGTTVQTKLSVGTPNDP